MGLALLDGVCEELSDVLEPILFQLFFCASSFPRSLSFPALLYIAVPHLWDFCVPPECRPLILVLPGHGCIACTAHFSCIMARHVVHCPGLFQSWRFQDAFCKTSLLSNVAIPGWLITIWSSETIISSRSCPLLSFRPPLHDVDFAFKSLATMTGACHLLVPLSLPSLPRTSQAMRSVCSGSFSLLCFCQSCAGCGPSSMSVVGSYRFVLGALSQLCERYPKAKYLKHLGTVTFSRTLAIVQPILTFSFLMMFNAFARGIVTRLSSACRHMLGALPWRKIL